MKKTLLAGIVAGIMMIGMVGTVSADTFTSKTDLHTILYGTGTFSWNQAMPTNFEMPYDTINSAKLTVYANFAGGSNDKILVENTFVGTLKNDTFWTWLPMESTALDIASYITGPWSTGQALNVRLDYKETGLLNFLYLDKSVLTLDYNNKSAPVPEPGTMMLLGLGLVVLAVYGKRRMNK